MLGYCWLGSVSDVVQAAVAVALLVFAIKEYNKAYQQWRNEKAVQRSKFLETLMDKFGKDNIQSMVSLAGDPTTAQKWLCLVMNDRQKEMEAQSSFRFFSYLCYLLDNRLITESEFGLFENALKVTLSNEQVQEYFRIAMSSINDNGLVATFKNLLDYAISHHINDDVYTVKGNSDDNKSMKQESVVDSIESVILEENKKKPSLTVEELSQHPIVLIRINRLYRSDMTPNELYSATRGWWRVNIDVANKAKYALSIAEDRVRAVYAIKGAWHKYGTTEEIVDDGADGRYQFEGEPVKDDAIIRMYLGRSIKGLFRQGDAYPVRYFGVTVSYKRKPHNSFLAF